MSPSKPIYGEKEMERIQSKLTGLLVIITIGRGEPTEEQIFRGNKNDLFPGAA
jgi:hypothetical protein